MGYKGKAVFRKDGAPMSVEMETGHLDLLGQPPENRKAFIRSIDDSNLKFPGVELPIPAGASDQIVLRAGRYVLESPASSEEHEFVISHSIGLLLDVPYWNLGLIRFS